MTPAEVLKEIRSMPPADRRRVLEELSKANGDLAPNGTKESRPISEIAKELSSKVPYEEWAKLPRDGAENYKHYLYGHPKKSK